MTDGSTSAGAAETSVSDESNSLVQFHSGKSTCRVEHLSHAGTALRAFVSDNNHIAVNNLSIVDSIDSILFAVEYSRRTAVLQHFRSYSTSLYNASVLSDIAPHYRDTACLTVRLVNRSDDVIILDISTLDVFADSLAGSSYETFVDETLLCQFAENSHESAGTVQVMHVSVACRSQMAEVRNLGTELIEDIQIQLNTGLVGDSQQMEHAV